MRKGTILLVLALAGCGGPPVAAVRPPAGVMNVADAAIAGGDPGMALKVSRAVLADDPRNLDALYHEGAAYYAVNRCMDSVAAYQVALRLDPSSATAELGIGRCLLRQDAGQAESAFAAAVRDDPEDASAQADLGIARDLQGHHDAAAAPYQQALLLDPGNEAIEVDYGMSLALGGHGAAALQFLGPLAAGGDATPKIRQDYATALLASGRTGEARAVLALDLPPDAADVLLNDLSAAIVHQNQAAVTAPTQPVLATVPVKIAAGP